MANALVRKLQSHARLGAEDLDALEAICVPARRFPARHDLIREGDKPGPLFVVLEGWACRYKVLPDGSRQITAFLMPGDFCDMHAAMLDEMDHTIATVSPATVAVVPHARVQELLDGRPAVLRAFWWAQLVDEGVLRAWIVSMGRRDSLERVAHLMCELYVRARNIGLTEDYTFDLPLTQPVLGDALGLTPVHVNRVLRKLRLTGAMNLVGGELHVADVTRLAAIAGFDDNYLHRRLARTAASNPISASG